MYNDSNFLEIDVFKKNGRDISHKECWLFFHINKFGFFTINIIKNIPVQII